MKRNRKSYKRLPVTHCFASASIAMMIGLSGCQQSADQTAQQNTEQPVAEATEIQPREAEPMLTENVEMLPPLETRAMMHAASLEAEQAVQGESGERDKTEMPQDEKARLEYMNTSNAELRRKVEELEAKLEHLDAISAEKSKAIEEVSRKLPQ